MFVTTNPFAANNHTAPTHLEFSRLCHQLQLFLGIVCVKILTMLVTTSSGTCGSINTWFFEHRVHTEFFAGRDMGVNVPNSHATVLDVEGAACRACGRVRKRTRQWWIRPIAAAFLFLEGALFSVVALWLANHLLVPRCTPRPQE